ncbi:MAG: DUF1566 domain-containing protein [Myxococcales bacterium]|nr:DUF1566 domain-containing protein [Myxococcales bacterium]
MKKNFLLIFLLLALLPACDCDGNNDTGGKSDDDSVHDAGDDTMDDDTDLDDDSDNVTGSAWTDPLTGLTWRVRPRNENLTWEDAATYCANLELPGGNWRLPTISELRTLIHGCVSTEPGGSCGVTDSCLDYEECVTDACKGCGNDDGPNHGCYGPPELPGPCKRLWSSSSVAGVGYDAWYIYFGNAAVFRNDVVGNGTADVRCVRP